MDYIWLVIVALGVISSLINKGKTKSKDNPSSMPTFGGNGERSLQPRPITSESDDTNRNFSPSPDYETGEGVSQMWNDTMQERNYDMQQDIDRVTAAFDDISGPPSKEWNAYDNSDEELRQSESSRGTNQVVNGVIWSEILGPPRAKRPYNNRQS
ncbi:hypothetical protein [Paenibacillus glacialis]|uniref:Uncharacterized protein n=1 Tax=Paenibacillus glacialis TaxID=494026 RepID=A0A168D804_9BACL|nr:hypothetical protein [Paenibacillus glacialis]OAB33956.1 hypothetical protein PGLA_23925 [Paenibacillus glacialis]